jgi:hypothetical protein
MGQPYSGRASKPLNYDCCSNICRVFLHEYAQRLSQIGFFVRYKGNCTELTAVL